MSQPLIHNEDQVNESPATDLSIAMSQINLREGEIKGLNEENFKLKQDLTQINEENNKILSDKKQLQKKVNELNEKVKERHPFKDLSTLFGIH